MLRSQSCSKAEAGGPGAPALSRTGGHKVSSQCPKADLETTSKMSGSQKDSGHGNPSLQERIPAALLEQQGQGLSVASSSSTLAQSGAGMQLCWHNHTKETPFTTSQCIEG